jgi:hypothetical protein
MMAALQQPVYPSFQEISMVMDHLQKPQGPCAKGKGRYPPCYQ